jgi:Mu-like prophage tail protein gpP
MSKSYKVKQGDTLGAIAIKYYGLFEKWIAIKNSNPQLLGRKKAVDGSPLIYPGDTLIIPVDSQAAPETNTAKPETLSDAEQDISIMIGGKTFTGFSAYKITEPIDTLDTFSLTAPFDDSVKDFHEAFRPFTYKECAIYYKGKIIFNGRLLTPNPDVQPDSKSINLQGYPLCGVLNDVHLPVTKYPPQYKGLKLSSIAEDALGPFGISVKMNSSQGSSFTDVSYEPQDKILQFLTNLGEQRGLLFTNDSSGNLVFFKPKAGASVATFKEGELPFVSCTPNFDPQNFYSHLTGFTKASKKAKSTHYTYENKYLTKRGILRPFSFVVDDADDNDLESAVKAKAGRMFASAVSYTLVVMDHTDKSGSLYAKNVCVSVKAPGAMIYKETKLLARQIELSRDDKEGKRTTFSLVMPGSYDGELPEVFPWEE